MKIENLDAINIDETGGEGKEQPVNKKENKEFPQGLRSILLDSKVVEENMEFNRERSKKSALKGSVLESTSYYLPERRDEYLKILGRGTDFARSSESIQNKLSRDQGFWRSLGRSAVKTVPNILSGAADTVFGVMGAAIERNPFASEQTKGDNNFYNRMKFEIDRTMEAIDENFKVHMPSDYQDRNVLERMGTKAFWMNDVKGLVENVVGQAFSQVRVLSMLNWAGKGVKWADKGMKAGNALNKAKNYLMRTRAAKIHEKAPDFIKRVGWADVYGTMSNAAMAGMLQGYEAREGVIEGLEGKLNPETGEAYTSEEIRDIAAGAAANTYNSVFLAHLVTGSWQAMAINRMFLPKSIRGSADGGHNPYKQFREKVNEEVKSGTLRYDDIFKNPRTFLPQIKPGKAMKKHALKGALYEHAEANYEEAFTYAEIDAALRGDNPKFMERMVNYGKQMIANYGDNDISSMMVIAAGLGAFTGAARGYKETKAKNKSNVDFSNRIVSRMVDADNLFVDNVQSIMDVYEADVLDSEGKVIHKKGEVRMGEDGKPVINPRNVAKLFKQIVAKEHLADQAVRDLLNNSEDGSEMNTTLSIASSLWEEIKLAEAYGETAEDAANFLIDRLSIRLENEYDLANPVESVKREAEDSDGDSRPESTEAKTPEQLKLEQDSKTPEQLEDEAAESPEAQEEAQKEDERASRRSKFLQEKRHEIRGIVNNLLEAFKESKEDADNLYMDMSEKDGAKVFAVMAQKTLLMEAAKRTVIDSIVQKRFGEEVTGDSRPRRMETGYTVEELQKLRQESIERSEYLLNNIEDAYASWDQVRTVGENFRLIQDAYNRKAPSERTPEDTKNYNEALFEVLELNYKYGSPIQALNLNEYYDPSERVNWTEGNLSRAYEKLGEQAFLNQEAISRIEELEAAKEVVTLKEALDIANTLENPGIEVSQKLEEVAENMDEVLDEMKASLSDAIDPNLAFMYNGYDEATSPTHVKPERREEVEAHQSAVKEQIRAKEDLVKFEERARANRLPNIDDLENTIHQEFLDSFEDMANYVISQSESLGDSFSDITGTTKALHDVEVAIDGISAMLEGVESGSEAQSYEDRLDRLVTMKSVLEDLYETAMLNKANKEAKQRMIAYSKASFMSQVFAKEGDSAGYELVKKLLGPKHSDMIEQAMNAEHPFEAMSALMKAAAEVNLKDFNAYLDSRKKDIRDTLNTFKPESLKKNVYDKYINRYLNNPQKGFGELLKQIAVFSSDVFSASNANTTKNSPHTILAQTLDIDKFINSLETATEETLGIPLEVVKELLEIHREYQGIVEARKAGNLHPDASPEKLLEVVESESFAPSHEQESSIRDGVEWYHRKHSNKAWASFGLIQGIAGTGKTYTIGLLTRVLGLNKGDVVALASTDNAARNLGNSLNVDAQKFQDFNPENIPAEAKLIIIDEYAAIDFREMQDFEAKIRKANVERENKIKVLLAGDPNQIIAEGGEPSNVVTETNGPDASYNITHLNHLTVPYRSGNTAISDTSEIFQGNVETVDELSTRVNSLTDPLAQGVKVVRTPESFKETIAKNIEEEKRLGKTPRTRAIAVSNPEHIGMFSDVDPSVQVMTIAEIQSGTVDEVYVYVDPALEGNPTEINKLYYTGITRATQYVEVVHEGSTIEDKTLTQESETFQDQIKDSKEDFEARKNAEMDYKDQIKSGEDLEAVKKETPEVKVEQKDVESTKVTNTKDLKEGEVVSKEADFTDEFEDDVDYDTSDLEEVAEIDSPTLRDDGTIDSNLPEPLTKVEEENDTIDDSEPIHVTPEGQETSEPTVSVISNPTEEKRVNRDNVSYVDSDFYNEISQESAEDFHGRDAIYLKDGDNILIFIQKGDNGWVKSGQYSGSDKTLNTSIREKYNNAPSLPTELKRSLMNGTPLTKDVFGDSLIGEGTVASYNRMSFKYNKKRKSEYNNVVDHNEEMSRGAFGNSENQKRKEKQSYYWIFSHTDIEQMDSPIDLKAGLPYLIIGANNPEGSTNTQTFIIPQQATRLSQDSEQVQVLSAFKSDLDALANSEGVDLSHIKIGTQAFSTLMKVAKDSLQVVTSIESKGDHMEKVHRVVPKDEYTVEDYQNAFERYKEYNRSSKDPLEVAIREGLEHMPSVIAKMQQLATHIYGYSTKDRVFTESEMHDFANSLPEKEVRNFEVYEETTDAEGNIVKTYIARNPSNDNKTEKDIVLSSKHGKAQIAFNQLARANEFVGKTRIRVQTPVGDGKFISTGRSLLTASQGQAKIYNLRNLFKSLNKDLRASDHERSLSDARWNRAIGKTAKDLASEKYSDTSQGHLQAYYDMIRERIENSDTLTDDRKTELLQRVEEIMNEQTTPLASNETINAIVDPNNYKDGRHRIDEEVETIRPDGEVVRQTTHLRTPINRASFNKIGADPQANKAEIDKFVTSRFEGVEPTRLSIDTKEDIKSTETSETPTAPDGSRENVSEKVREDSESLTGDTISEESNKVEGSKDLEAKLTGNDRAAQIAKLEQQMKAAEESGDFDAYIELDEKLNKLIRRTFTRNEPPRDGISRERAVEIYKELLPDASESELVFLDKLMLDMFARPGENLYGLYQKNGISLAYIGDGKVSEKVLRHEIFHKVYHEYLTDSERSQLNFAIDPDGRMTVIEIEEALSDRFMEHKFQFKEPKGFLRTLFDNILKFFGLLEQPDIIEEVFNRVHRGEYRKVSQNVNAPRRAYSNFNNFESNADIYETAKAKVVNSMMDYFDGGKKVGKISVPLDEVYWRVKDQLQIERDTLERRIETSKKMIEKATEMGNLEAAEKLKKAGELTESLLKEFEYVLPKRFTKGGKPFYSEVLLRGIWDDLFPNFNYSSFDRSKAMHTQGGENKLKKDWVQESRFQEIIDEYNNSEAEVNLEEVQELIDSTSSDPESAENLSNVMKDYVLQSDQVDYERKSSAITKGFFQSIVNPETGRRVFPKGAYNSALNLLAQIDSNFDFIPQLEANARKLGIHRNDGSDDAAVLNALINVYENTSGYKLVEFNHKGKTEKTTVNLEDTIFTNVDTYTQKEFGATKTLENGTEQIGRWVGEYTDEFVNRVINTEKERYTEYYNQLKAKEKVGKLDGEKVPTQDEFDYNLDLIESRIINSFNRTFNTTLFKELFKTLASQETKTFMIGESGYGVRRGAFRKYQVYRRARLEGEESGIKADVREALVNKWTSLDWTVYDTLKDPEKKLTHFINKMLGIESSTAPRLDRAKSIVTNIDNRRIEIQRMRDELEAKSAKDKSNTQEEIHRSTIEDILREENTLLEGLTDVVSGGFTTRTTNVFRDSTGKVRFGYHNGSQGTGILRLLQNNREARSKKDIRLPAHLTSAWGSKNIFGENPLNKVYEIVVHDAQKSSNSQYVTQYMDESPKDQHIRTFLHGFAQFMQDNSVNNEEHKNRYIQFLPTTSDRPQSIGAVVDVMTPKDIHKALERMYEQHLAQPSKEVVKKKNYDPDKFISGDQMKQAINSLKKEGIKNPTTKQVAERTYRNLIEASKDTLATLERMGILEDMNLSGAADKFSGKEMYNKDLEKVLGKDASVEAKMVATYWTNNYLNSYFLTQSITGNVNFFKSGNDLVKRLALVVAPGYKHYSAEGSGLFMDSSFRIGMSNDPILTVDELSEVFKDTRVKDKVESDGGIELADAEGYMTPERFEELQNQYGDTLVTGNVLKPVFFGQEAVLDDEGNIVDYAPVAVKYSAKVLTDEMVSKYPKLGALRDYMRDKNLGEYVFDTAGKVGAPLAQRPAPSPNASLDTWTFSDEGILELPSQNYRLQHDPIASPIGSVSLFTQLSFFINTGHDLLRANKPETAAKNEAKAAEVYDSLAALTRLGWEKVEGSIGSTGAMRKSFIADSLRKGVENERSLRFLEEGFSYNLPNIVDKATIQLMNSAAKTTVQPKFAGGQFVLQSAYGIELIKPDSDYANKIYGEGENANFESLTPYGKEVVQNMTVDSRNLMYKEEGKRVTAEVILPKEFATATRVGDFLLPDAMGYRIPSTGLHSSIAVKVVGYYDSKGTNVIIAPPELVTQHGSDFDVDSLFVVGREKIRSNFKEIGDEFKKNHFPGYYANEDGKLVFNKQRFIDFLDGVKRSKTSEAAKREIREVEMMFHRNNIVESFIDVISDEGNWQTMSEPISTDSIKNALDSLGLKEQMNVDLSNPEHNQIMQMSSSQGARLIGIFANGAKSLAYMLKAGVGKDGKATYPVFRMFNEDNPPVRIGKESYGTFQEKAGEYPIWSVLDALINTATDNINEQQLYLMNATSHTGKHYIAGTALGIPMEELISFMRSPVIKSLSDNRGKISLVEEELMGVYERLMQSDNSKDAAGDPINNSVQLLERVKDIEVDLDTLKENMHINLNDISSLDQLYFQAAVLREFKKIDSLAGAISTVSTALGIVQGFPVTYDKIVRMDSKWSEIVSRDEETGDLVFDEDFPIDISNLFNSQPNILAAYEAYESTKNVMENSFVKHHTNMNYVVNKLAHDLRISNRSEENLHTLKNSVYHFLLSSMYADELASQDPYTYKDGRYDRVLTGADAFSHKFAESLRKRIVENDKLSSDKSNKFLRSLSVETVRGVSRLTFHANRTSDIGTDFRYRYDFLQLDSQTQYDLIKYAVINFGAGFGARNYSTHLGGEHLVALDKYINSNIKNFVNNHDALSNIINSEFIIEMAANNPTSLPRFRSKERTPVRLGSRVIDGGETPVYSGIEDGTYFDRKFNKNNIDLTQELSEKMSKEDIAKSEDVEAQEVGEKDTTDLDIEMVEDSTTVKQGDSTKYPLFYHEEYSGRATAYIKVKETDTAVYYQSLGHKQTNTYNSSKLDLLPEEYQTRMDMFKDGIIPVPHIETASKAESRLIEQWEDSGSEGDIPLLQVKVKTDGVKTGDLVLVYPSSDISRKLGEFKTVKDVKFNKEAHESTLTLERDAADPETVKLVKAMNNITQEFKNRYNANVMFQSLPGNVKGMIKDGNLVINKDIVTTLYDLNETAFHELSHPIIADISKRNPNWYNNLIQEMKDSKKGRDLLEKVKELYPELTETQVEMEALVTMIGRKAAEHRTYGNSLAKKFGILRKKFISLVAKILKTAGVKITRKDLESGDLANITIGELGAVLSDTQAAVNFDVGRTLKDNSNWNQVILNEAQSRLMESGRLQISCKV